MFVPSDIEHDQIADRVCGWESRPEFVKILKICCIHDLEPPYKCGLTVRMFFPEISQRFPADDVHRLAVSHIEIFFNTADNISH